MPERLRDDGVIGFTLTFANLLHESYYVAAYGVEHRSASSVNFRNNGVFKSVRHFP